MRKQGSGFLSELLELAVYFEWVFSELAREGGVGLRGHSEVPPIAGGHTVYGSVSQRFGSDLLP